MKRSNIWRNDVSRPADFSLTTFTRALQYVKSPTYAKRIWDEQYAAFKLMQRLAGHTHSTKTPPPCADE